MERLKRLWHQLAPEAAATPRKVWYAPYKFQAYGSEEIEAVTAALREGWLAPGPRAQEFEAKVSKLFGRLPGMRVWGGRRIEASGMGSW